MKSQNYFTPNTSLFKVVHCKEFAPFKKYIINPRQYRFVMQVYKIKHLRLFYPFDATVIADALNDMYDRRARGEQLFYDFGDDVGMYVFAVDKSKPFVLILPGGAYGDVCSFSEGFPTAVWLNKLGYNAIVGQYRVGKEAHYPNPQDDVAKMISYAIKNADALGINARDYVVCGFSAGGHLAASWGTKSVGYAKYNLLQPSALFLSYPVITMGEYAHKGSRKNLLGKDAENEEIQRLYSIEQQADGDYPPTFIWQCKNDKVVPFKNSQMLAETLAAHNVPCKLMPVEGTAHGWGLAKGTAADGWLEKAVDFWQTYGERK